jgi:hypothetical protein
MSRKESFIHASGAGEFQETQNNANFYCTECTKTLLSWKPNAQQFEPSASMFHRDLFELMECGKRCSLCSYICSLYKGPHLERFLSRVAEHNDKPEEELASDAANKMVYREGGFTSPLSLSRAPKGPPTVIIAQNVDNSYLDERGRRNHLTLRVDLGHHVSEIEDRREFVVCTAAGTHIVLSSASQLTTARRLDN